MGGNEKIFYRNCSSHLTTHISRFIKLKQTVDSCFFSILCKVLKLVLFNFTAAKPVLKISQVGKKQLKTAVQFQAMRTSKVKSFKSNFMAIGWHVSALFVINSLLTGSTVNNWDITVHVHIIKNTRFLKKFSLAKIYVNLWKSRFSWELYL